MAQRASWTGPVLLSYGFRPFLLFAAVWAALAMLAWILLLAGGDVAPIAFTPTDWHVHSLVFGYSSAVMTGFLLTAVPHWTGRPARTSAPQCTPTWHRPAQGSVGPVSAPVSGGRSG